MRRHKYKRVKRPSHWTREGSRTARTSRLAGDLNVKEDLLGDNRVGSGGDGGKGHNHKRSKKNLVHDPTLFS